MSLPEAPQTRTEQYLNAIATDDTSGIPEAPQTRMEQYLDVIANNGGGGGSAALEVTLTADAQMNLTADKTAAEIYAAKMNVVFTLDVGVGVLTMALLASALASGSYTFIVGTGYGEFSGQKMLSVTVLTAASGTDYPSGAMG